MDTITACKKTRALAANTFAIALQTLQKNHTPFSEVMLRDAWLSELQKNQDIFPDGWYIPPPHGIGILFGPAIQNSRTNYRNLREEVYSPNPNIYFDNKNDMAYIYASPVDKKSGTIGDFGMVLYRGTDEKVKNHLKRCLEIDKAIFEQITVGMTFAQIYETAEKIFTQYQLSNNVISTTDKAVINIGHSVPSFAELSSEEVDQIQQHDWMKIKDMLSKKRLFINALEQTVLQSGMCITLEPRLTVSNDSAMPMASYHVITSIDNKGHKELLTNFDTIFQLGGMEYML